EHHHGPRVADMRVVVNRRAADIHPHVLGIDRRERLLLAREGVVEVDGHAVSPFRRFSARSRPISGSSSFSSGPWSEAVSAWRSGMNSSLPLRPVAFLTALVQALQ